MEQTIKPYLSHYPRRLIEWILCNYLEIARGRSPFDTWNDQNITKLQKSTGVHVRHRQRSHSVVEVMMCWKADIDEAMIKMSKKAGWAEIARESTPENVRRMIRIHAISAQQAALAQYYILDGGDDKTSVWTKTHGYAIAKLQAILNDKYKPKGE